jgi:hypothetical protein
MRQNCDKVFMGWLGCAIWLLVPGIGGPEIHIGRALTTHMMDDKG